MVPLHEQTLTLPKTGGLALVVRLAHGHNASVVKLIKNKTENTCKGREVGEGQGAPTQSSDLVGSGGNDGCAMRDLTCSCCVGRVRLFTVTSRGCLCVA